ncbi:putative (di)nucleoside polyphosphate hydrolase [Pasteurella testudinis DSM 23072]|uniref:Putative (Di)nucleoside polyphosphate hydrolase n=1 Tax=Pasteurella testudinis DSM 23072 TaxID=1122938 RepID=A0A1W1UP06_9PAST|nr:putative (di)nucleoside polyphosphate hydrolase [Pasteurella testudinis DSM 23072]SUB52728.1 RNA pyrophosphohydrolase [Pasteurella testudinis]
MYRELYEEVGLSRQDVKILAVSKGWLRYKLPKRLVRNDSNPVCIGQKQRWFLLALISDENNINMQATKNPEFDGWRWVSYWYPVRQVISFKREVYRKVMKEFAAVIMVQPDKASAAGKSHQQKNYRPHAKDSSNHENSPTPNPTPNKANTGKTGQRYQRRFNNKRAVQQKGEKRR